MNLDALQKQVQNVKGGGNSKSAEDRKRWQVPTLQVGEEMTFSLVENHKHAVLDGSPFVPVKQYRFKSKSSKFGSNSIVHESAFDESLIDPVSTYLEKLKEKYAEKNNGDNTIPKELYRTLMPTTYLYVPVVVRQKENEGVKWLKLSPTSFESIKTIISKWYNFDTGKRVDFEMSRPSSTSYNFGPSSSEQRAIQIIDKGILESSLEELPSLQDILYVINNEDTIKAVKENVEIISQELGDESEVSYGGEGGSQAGSNVDPSLKNDVQDKISNLFGDS